MTTLTPPPTAPDSNDPATFEARADALVAWLATFVSEATVLAAAMDAAAAGGVFSLGYTFSTTTTDADPGAGYLRLNNATQNAATVLRVDLTDLSGNDQTNALDLFNDSTSAICGFIKLFKFSDPTKYLIFSVTSVASPSGYRNVTGACVAYSAASPFSNGDQIELEFTRTGDKGDTGATGPAFSTANVTLTATTTLDGGGTALVVDLNSNHANGPYGQMKKSGSAFVYFGTAYQAVGSSFPNTAWGMSCTGAAYWDAAGSHNFLISGSSRAVVTATGINSTNIGATTPGTLAATTGAFSGVVTLNSTNGENLRITGVTTGPNILSLTNTGGQAIFGQENSAGGNIIIGSTAYDTVIRGPSGISFSANAGGSLSARITSTGVALGCLLDLSAAAAGQIKFPATQNASSNVNTLDDYERGTWSGSFTFGGAAVGMTVSVGGQYVKVGRKVTQTFDFALTTKGSSTGTALFSNCLAFTPPAGYGAGVTVNSGVSMTLTGVLALNQWNRTGTTNLDVMALSNGGQTVLTDTAFANGSQFYTEISYISAA